MSLTKHTSMVARVAGGNHCAAANDEPEPGELTPGDVGSIADELTQFPLQPVRMSREHPTMTEHGADQMMLAEQRRMAAMGWPTW